MNKFTLFIHNEPGQEGSEYTLKIILYPVGV